MAAEDRERRIAPAGLSGVTEPSSGTDTSSLKTFARREGNDSYIVNGQKILDQPAPNIPT